MKKMRKIIPALAMLLVSAIMMSTASFAWFSMGTTATVDGMKVKATASSSLIIDNDVAKLTSADQTVSFTSSAAELKPATHNTETENFTTKLGRPNNEQGINAGTGIMETGNTLVEAGTGYYYDYVVYIATTGGAALEGKKLCASITVPEVLTNYIHNAVTIDFWVREYENDAPKAENAYKVKTNLLNVVTNGTAVDGNKTLKVEIMTGLDIPLLVEDETDATLSYVAITMRVYFDGDLRDGANCYIRNTKASVAEAGFSVEFSAE